MTGLLALLLLVGPSLSTAAPETHTAASPLDPQIPNLLPDSLQLDATGFPVFHENPIQQANLYTARDLLALNSMDSISNLDKAVALAERAMTHQADLLGVALGGTHLQNFSRPSGVLRSLAAIHDYDGLDEATMNGLDGLSEPLRSSLAWLLESFMYFDISATYAFQSIDSGILVEMQKEAAESMLDLDSRDVDSIKNLRDIPAIGADLGPLLSARAHFLSAVVDFIDAWRAMPPDWSAPQNSHTDMCPLIAFDLAGQGTHYPNDCLLIIDVGGDDEYFNNAGGANTTRPAAAVVDLGGMDTYGNPILVRSGGINGGGFLGAGFLLDASFSKDTYNAGGQGANGGGANLGIGFLLDVGGNDEYLASGVGVNGGGSFIGIGLLVDQSGDDKYNASGNSCRGFVFPSSSGCGFFGSWGVNGGSWYGIGTLIDGDGSDLYDAGYAPPCPASGCVAGTGGVNGGGDVGGAGFLFDAAGSDFYRAGTDVNCQEFCSVGSFGVNGGGNYQSVGFLADIGGNDKYLSGVNGILNCEEDITIIGIVFIDTPACTSGSFGVNGGANLYSFGLLIDNYGDDSYQSNINTPINLKVNIELVSGILWDVGAGNYGINGGGSLGGDGSLLDLSVNADHYEVGTGSTYFCTGCLASLPYVLDLPINPGEKGVNGGGYFGSGKLIDAGGNDHYRANGDLATNGGATAGFGLLLDEGGFDAYEEGGAVCMNSPTSPTSCTVAPKGEFGAQIDGQTPNVAPPILVPPIPGGLNPCYDQRLVGLESFPIKPPADMHLHRSLERPPIINLLDWCGKEFPI